MTKLNESFYEGWSVQIYDNDRRLLFSLYPSHGWVFFFGVLLGFCLALFGIRHDVVPPGEREQLQNTAPIEAPLSLD